MRKRGGRTDSASQCSLHGEEELGRLGTALQAVLSCNVEGLRQNVLLHLRAHGGKELSWKGLRPQKPGLLTALCLH